MLTTTNAETAGSWSKQDVQLNGTWTTVADESCKT
jgi:hypothetical protein